MSREVARHTGYLNPTHQSETVVREFADQLSKDVFHQGEKVRRKATIEPEV